MDLNNESESAQALLSTGEVARRFSVHPTTVWRMAKAGKLRRIMMPNGSTRYSAAEVERIARGKNA